MGTSGQKFRIVLITYCLHEGMALWTREVIQMEEPEKLYYKRGTQFEKYVIHSIIIILSYCKEWNRMFYSVLLLSQL